jgi:hypothetical protein
MRANEFRIGNYIENDIGDIIRIDESNLPYIVTKWIKCHHAISLTEKWFLKLGFDKKRFTSLVMELYPLTIYKQDGVFWVDLSWESLELKYVHQLQNLYFALTSEELTIN